MTKEKQAPLGDKVRSSLVLKLNLRMLRGLISAFFLINILVFSLLLLTIVYRINLNNERLFNTYSIEDLIEDPTPASLVGYEEKKILRNLGDIIPIDGDANLRPYMKQDGFSHRFFYPEDTAETSFRERFHEFRYEIELESGDKRVLLSMPIGLDIEIAFWLILALAFIEILIVLTKARTNTRAVRRILAPLAELSAATKTLQQVTSSQTALDEQELESLALELQDIDASSLDKRLNLKSDQNELQDLTSAINGMLDRVRQSYQSQIRFVSDASHELRTPIAVIQGYINLLDRWGKEDEAVRDEAITAIKTETESMKLLIEQLLFLARGENHSMKLKPERFLASTLADEIIKEAKLIDKTHEYTFILNEDAEVFADKQYIKQAIRILIDNAEKYSPDGENILLKVDKKDQTVRFEVQDHGIGIDSEDVLHIFDRFYRSDESRARTTGGSGLGLAIAKWIAIQHKGYYEVTSRKDIGTRISLVLPAA